MTMTSRPDARPKSLFQPWSTTKEQSRRKVKETSEPVCHIIGKHIDSMTAWIRYTRVSISRPSRNQPIHTRRMLLSPFPRPPITHRKKPTLFCQHLISSQVSLDFPYLVHRH